MLNFGFVVEDLEVNVREDAFSSLNTRSGVLAQDFV